MDSSGGACQAVAHRPAVPYTLMCDKIRDSRVNQHKTPVVFSTMYSSQYKDICQIVRKHFPILLSDPALHNVVGDGIKCVSRRAPRLGQKLSPSLFSSIPHPVDSWLSTKGSYRCGHNRCTCCKVMQISKTFLSYATQRSYNILSYINCNTKWVIYLISCTTCKLQYVGCTGQHLKERIRRHIYDIPYTPDRNVSAASMHFACVHGGNFETMTVQGIERVSLPIRGGDLRRLLLNQEAYWIFALKTRVPSGLNKRHDLILHIKMLSFSFVFLYFLVQLVLFFPLMCN